MKVISIVFKIRNKKLKKLSRIFYDSAQPIATVIASWIGAKQAKSITNSKNNHLPFIFYTQNIIIIHHSLLP